MLLQRELSPSRQAMLQVDDGGVVHRDGGKVANEVLKSGHRRMDRGENAAQHAKALDLMRLNGLGDDALDIREVVIEGLASHLRFIGDRSHGHSPNAILGDELKCGLDDALPGADRRLGDYSDPAHAALR